MHSAFTNRITLRHAVLVSLLLAAFVAEQAMADRVKDLASVAGVRNNQLTGYGLVVGLKGTGDSLRNSPFTAQSLRSMLDRLGVNVRGANPRTRNVAAVLITAELPPFVGAGSRIDISVAFPTPMLFKLLLVHHIERVKTAGQPLLIRDSHRGKAKPNCEHNKGDQPPRSVTCGRPKFGT